MAGEKKERRQGCFWFGLRWSLRIAVVVVLLAVVLFLVVFRGPLYHRFYLFPRQADAVEALEAARVPVTLETGWNEYRGVMHSHSEVSHDSIMKHEDILAALKEAGCRFILMSDHCVDGKADYSWGWKGLHDGVLFVRGFEMGYGFIPWGLPDDTVLSKSDPPEVLAQQIEELGGTLAICHSEEERNWELPQIKAMEVYNVHTNIILKEEEDDDFMRNLFKEVIINHRAYPEQTIRTLFDRDVLDLMLRKWDGLNTGDRTLTGFAGNDCHNNFGYRGIYTEDDAIYVIDTGHDDPAEKAAEFELNVLTRLLARMLFAGPLEPGKEVFRFDLDPYARMSHYVNTHVLAGELSEPSVLEAVREGRAFFAFNMIGDATGFAFVAQNGGEKATLGEQIALAPGTKLRAESPLPCRFILVRNGERIAEMAGPSLEYDVSEPGKYRLEAELDIAGEWTPWVYTNPIEVLPPSAA